MCGERLHGMGMRRHETEHNEIIKGNNKPLEELNVQVREKQKEVETLPLTGTEGGDGEEEERMGLKKTKNKTTL